jgi:hypothetical protein
MLEVTNELGKNGELLGHQPARRRRSFRIWLGPQVGVMVKGKPYITFHAEQRLSPMTMMESSIASMVP